MKKFVTLCAVALASLVLFASCNKSDKPEDVAVKFTMELNNGNYDAAKALTNSNGAQLVDLLQQMKDMSGMQADPTTEESDDATATADESSEAVEAPEAQAAAPETAAPAPKTEEKVLLTEADLEVKKSEVRGDSAFVWILNKEEPDQGELPLVLVKQNGEWKVDKIDKENK